MQIRAKTFKSWMMANLKESLPDIANHGADSGFPGITYYSDTVALYDKFEDEIWEALNEDAEDLGNSNPIELIATFNGAKNVSDATTFKNLLTWYMAERIAREYTDKREAHDES